MKKNKFYLVIILVLVTVLGCKKDDDVKPNKEQLISGGSSKNWKITGAEGKVQDLPYSFDFFNKKIYISGQEVPTALIPKEYQDIPAVPECVKDNIIVFKADKTYETNEGASVCTTEQQFILITKGTWALSADEKELILSDASGQQVKYVISDLSATTIKGDTSGLLPVQGVNYNYTLTTTLTAQ